MRFNVTYEIVTPESAEYGDADERGFLAENATLREAIELVQETRTSHVGGVECVEPNCWPGLFSWITVINSAEYLTGAQESRSIHIPDSVTPASRARILRLLKFDLGASSRERHGSVAPLENRQILPGSF